MSEPEDVGMRDKDGSYTSVIVFWEVLNLESEVEEFNEETWGVVLRGRPGPSL